MLFFSFGFSLFYRCAFWCGCEPPIYFWFWLTLPQVQRYFEGMQQDEIESIRAEQHVRGSIVSLLLLVILMFCWNNFCFLDAYNAFTVVPIIIYCRSSGFDGVYYNYWMHLPSTETTSSHKRRKPRRTDRSGPTTVATKQERPSEIVRLSLSMKMKATGKTRITWWLELRSFRWTLCSCYSWSLIVIRNTPQLIWRSSCSSYIIQLLKSQCPFYIMLTRWWSQINLDGLQGVDVWWLW